ncbi:hypothetical protein [Mesobacterium pallidum]|uniref:hypothetical protein n=1 Tax=Mesobacterium pallidum TaxID=2872037 RepID=UPI001EE30327|nr:hypothetical protein [Mesobacterium pallidum]
MTIVEKGLIMGRLGASLKSRGIDVREVVDFGEVSEIVRRAGKPYLTPFSSPDFNDFTSENVLWLVGEREGEPAFIGCARLEAIGAEHIESWWSRVFGRAYAPGQTPILNNVRPNVARELRGRIVYFGDLYVAPKMRGSREALRTFVALGHIAVSLKWDPDWTYCFLRERDILRGAAAIYGFTRNFGRPFDWLRDPPAPRQASERLVALPREDLMQVAELAAQAVGSHDEK